MLIDQWFDQERCCAQPEHPGWTSLVFPLRNQYCLFGGEQAHGVLEAMPQQAAAGQAAAGQAAAGQEQQQEQLVQQQPQQPPPQQQQQPLQGRRATLLVNWWAQQPQSVGRATAEEVRQGKLAGAREGLEQEGSGGEGCSEPRRVELVSLQAPQLQAGDVLAVSCC